MLNISIEGGIFDTSVSTADAITMDYLDTVYQNVSMTGVTVSGGRSATRIEAPTGAGVLTSASMSFDYSSRTRAGRAHGCGQRFHPLQRPRRVERYADREGWSIYQDFTNSAVKIRKAAWTTL